MSFEFISTLRNSKFLQGCKTGFLMFITNPKPCRRYIRLSEGILDYYLGPDQSIDIGTGTTGPSIEPLQFFNIPDANAAKNKYP